MSEENKERQILMVMRKVLGSVIREITPEPGMRHPLSEGTIQDVKMCFGLIAAREKELADAAGVQQERPYFTDEPPSAKVVPMDSIGRVQSGKKKGEGKTDPD
ncbi:MAG TPA: segregation and condensation protein A [Sedimenticola sp.]|nr:segregation and condensation protein A [Sedimenticola sp.]